MTLRTLFTGPLPHSSHHSQYYTLGQIQWAVSRGLNHSRIQGTDTACRFTCDNVRRTNSSQGSLFTRQGHWKHCAALWLHITAVSRRSTGRTGFSCLSAVRFNLKTKFLCHSKVTSPVRPREDLIPSSRAQCSVMAIWFWHIFTAAAYIEFPQWHSIRESQQSLNFPFRLLQFFS